jgi:hypothetical protein
MFFLYVLPLRCSLIYAVSLEIIIGYLALLMLWTLLVVCHRQPPVVEGDAVVPQIFLSLKSAATRIKKTDVFVELE